MTYRGADAEHRLQLQSTTALSPQQQQDLATIQRTIVSIFATVIQDIAPDYLQDAPSDLRPLTMSLFGMLNWFYLWHQPGRAPSRSAYGDMATDILLGGLERLTAQRAQPLA